MKNIITLAFAILLCSSGNLIAQISFTDNQILTDHKKEEGFLIVLPMVIADYDLDGFDDVILYNGRKIFARKNENGERLQEEVLLFENDVYIDDITDFIDLNNDGDLDFMISTIDSIVVIVNNNGAFKRSHAGPKPSNSYYSDLQLFDLDEDGNLELFCSTPGQIMINKNWENDISDFDELLN